MQFDLSKMARDQRSGRMRWVCEWSGSGTCERIEKMYGLAKAALIMAGYFDLTVAIRMQEEFAISCLWIFWGIGSPTSYPDRAQVEAGLAFLNLNESERAYWLEKAS